MNDARTLLHLQNLDIETETTEVAIADVEAHLGESPELLAAREAREAAHKVLDEFRAKQRELEYEVESLTGRIAAEEKQMYDGKGRGSRELEGLRKSVDGLKSHRRDIEDKILDTMSAVEQAQTDVLAQDTAYAHAEAEWRAGQGDLVVRAGLAPNSARAGGRPAWSTGGHDRSGSARSLRRPATAEAWPCRRHRRAQHLPGLPDLAAPQRRPARARPARSGALP